MSQTIMLCFCEIISRKLFNPAEVYLQLIVNCLPILKNALHQMTLQNE